MAKKNLNAIESPNTLDGDISNQKKKPTGHVQVASKTQSSHVTIMPRGLYIQTKTMDELPAKRKIAAYIANKYVKNFDAVLLDAGSTAEMVAEEMFSRRRFLSVLTNNMGAYASYTRARSEYPQNGENEHTTNSDIPGSLHGNELLISGGIYVDTYEALLGDVTMQTFSEFTPNIIIIGVSGLRWGEGVFCHGAEEATVKSLLWTKLTDIRLIATDWSKIGKRDAHSFGKLEELRVNANEAVVVTSNPPDNVAPKKLESFEREIKAMEKANIEVVRVNIEKN